MSKAKRKRSGRPKAQRKRIAVAKSGAVWHQSAVEATLAQKPHFNGYACGHGVHGDAKYNRTREKRAWKSQLRQEGASRGSFLFGLCKGKRYGSVSSSQNAAQFISAYSLDFSNRGKVP